MSFTVSQKTWWRYQVSSWIYKSGTRGKVGRDKDLEVTGTGWNVKQWD